MAELARSTASFRLMADALDPDAITGALGLTPSRGYRTGEVTPPRGPHGRPIQRRTGYWSLDSALPATATLDAHLAALLDLLEPNADAVRGWVGQGYTVEFFCGLFLHYHIEETSLAPRTLARIGALGAEVVLDIYSGDHDKEGSGDGFIVL